MSELQGLRVWKVWSFLGLSMALVVAVFLFQVETVLPGAPDVCEEPCEDEAVLSRNPTPVPALEPSEAASIDLEIAPDGSQTEPVETQVTEPSVVTIETPSPVDMSLPAPVEAEVSADTPPAGLIEAAPEPPTVPIDADVSAGDSSTVTSRVQEVQQLPVTVEPPVSVDGPASATVEVQLPVEIPLGELFEESATRREVTKREKATAQTKAAGPLATVEVALNELSRSAAVAPLPPEPRLLPFRLIVPAPHGSIPVARGAMGYRVPLVVKQEVPDQIQGGVYIPAHEAYVVLRPGYWELEGPNEGLTETEPEANATEASGDVVNPEPKRPNWLQRLFRRKDRGTDGGS